ncbi:hypothetical protein B0A49_01885 [Cryomyces minteri]|uniref:Probable methionine--tRNA ligase, mitochondrial n=1 Tax=Cryomyces minteri TaxID=331657 RepID=A0A4U0XTR8_9PEZI|nr:hypothetical protein B0A49_01885 [Cryomyces minteri]
MGLRSTSDPVNGEKNVSDRTSESPHVGHLYTMVLTDVLKRWQVLQGNKALLCTGTDEHGMKIQQASAKAGSEPKPFCDKGAEVFKSLAARAQVAYDHFVRTTDPAHKEAVQYAWYLLKERGYIYTSKHEGWYSVSDETFYPESAVHLILDPPTGRKIMASIETGKEVEWTSELNYHFRLSAFKDQLLELYGENPDWIVPQARMSDVVQAVSEGLEDLSISRPVERLTWGIPVPDDDSQTIYVWLDALINYITKAGYPWAPGQERALGWPADVQVIGKDIVRFHCIYWPAFLLALDIPPPQRILTHAHWTLGRKKMAKSTGNVVNPFFALDRFGVDTMRFYLAHDGGISQDADYGNEYIIERYKKSLQGGLGNLTSRILRAKNWNVRRAVERFAGKKVSNRSDHHSDQQMFLESLAERTKKYMDELNVSGAVRTIMDTVYQTNKYLQESSPWLLAEVEGYDSEARVDRIVYLCAESIRICGILLQPCMPDKMGRLMDMLGVDITRRSFEYTQVGSDVHYGVSKVDLGSWSFGAQQQDMSSMAHGRGESDRFRYVGYETDWSQQQAYPPYHPAAQVPPPIPPKHAVDGYQHQQLQPQLQPQAQYTFSSHNASAVPATPVHTQGVAEGGTYDLWPRRAQPILCPSAVQPDPYRDDAGCMSGPPRERYAYRPNPPLPPYMLASTATWQKISRHPQQLPEPTECSQNTQFHHYFPKLTSDQHSPISPTRPTQGRSLSQALEIQQRLAYAHLTQSATGRPSMLPGLVVEERLQDRDNGGSDAAQTPTGASALGFGRPSDWEYYNTSEEEEIDDTEGPSSENDQSVGAASLVSSHQPLAMSAEQNSHSSEVSSESEFWPTPPTPTPLNTRHHPSTFTGLQESEQMEKLNVSSSASVVTDCFGKPSTERFQNQGGTAQNIRPATSDGLVDASRRYAAMLQEVAKCQVAANKATTFYDFMAREAAFLGIDLTGSLFRAKKRRTTSTLASATKRENAQVADETYDVGDYVGDSDDDGDDDKEAEEQEAEEWECSDAEECSNDQQGVLNALNRLSCEGEEPCKGAELDPTEDPRVQQRSAEAQADSPQTSAGAPHPLRRQHRSVRELIARGADLSLTRNIAAPASVTEADAYGYQERVERTVSHSAATVDDVALPITSVAVPTSVETPSQMSPAFPDNSVSAHAAAKLAPSTTSSSLTPQDFEENHEQANAKLAMLTQQLASLLPSVEMASLPHPQISRVWSAIDTIGADDTSFLKQLTDQWEIETKNLRIQLDRERELRQEETEEHFSQLFNEREIGYADIAILEARSKHEELGRLANEEKAIYESYASNVSHKAEVFVKGKLTDLNELYGECVGLLHDAEARSTTSCDEDRLVAIFPVLLRVWQLMETRYIALTELAAEERRRRKKVIVQPLYAAGAIQSMKETEKAFDIEEKMALLQAAEAKHSRAQNLESTLRAPAKANACRRGKRVSEIVLAVEAVASHFLPSSPPDEAQVQETEILFQRARSTVLDLINSAVKSTRYIKESTPNDQTVAEASLGDSDVQRLRDSKARNAHSQRQMKDLEESVVVQTDEDGRQWMERFDAAVRAVSHPMGG